MEMEDIDHLFFTCDFSINVWKSVFRWLKVDVIIVTKKKLMLLYFYERWSISMLSGLWQKEKKISKSGT
jgi:hypothetical protein